MTTKNDKKKQIENKKERLVLLDAHAILHRAYHALPDFSSKSGEPTGALYGLSAMLIKIIQELKPDYLVACYDLPGPTYRHEAYDEYKAGRKKAEDDLIAQINRSRDIFQSLGIPMYDKAGFEADDILGTIVDKVKSDKNTEVIIASGDMDTLQLVSGDKVQVYTLKKGIKDTIIYNQKAVFERFGFLPALLPDYKGLRGDPSDNIIGVRGIGDKTATELIQKFGKIEDIYKKLKKDKKLFEGEGIKPRIIALLEENEEEALFSKMLATIKRDVPIDFKIPDNKWKTSLDLKKVEELFLELDFRTLNQRMKESFGEEEPSALSSEETPPKQEEKVGEDELREVSVALWIIDSNLINPDLTDILNFAKTDSFEEAKRVVLEELKKRGLSDVFEKIEKPIIPLIKEMEDKGILLDTKYLKGLSVEYHKRLEKLEKKIWQEAGVEFNINSPKQLSEILFEKLKLSVKGLKKTGGGARSTRESELEKLKDSHKIIGLILDYRGLQKLLSTYIDNMPAMVGIDGRLHTTFLQTGTTTGRMSSNNPNLQNIPIKTEDGRNIRNAFVSSKGNSFVAFDYSQIELRISALLSRDPKLLEIFKTGQDVHNAVASEVFGVSPQSVTPYMRRQAKVINFGILYGMGVNALRANLGSDRETAQKFYNDYFEKFKGLALFLEETKASAYRKGYTETLFGRRRYFPDIKSRIPYIRASAERMAINAPIQGTQADIIKIAMKRIDDYLEGNKFKEKVSLLLQVHDELIYEIDKGLVDKVCPEIKRIMESIVSPEESLGVKFEANVSVGKSWGKLEKQV